MPRDGSGWNDNQGQSAFVWCVIGGIAATTELKLTTAVTCPTIRLHPAIIAQAAATASLMMPGRFWLGVGSGEVYVSQVGNDQAGFFDFYRRELQPEELKPYSSLRPGPARLRSRLPGSR